MAINQKRGGWRERDGFDTAIIGLDGPSVGVAT